jgi:hypothetical protein
MMATNVRVHHEHCIPARPREKSVLPLAATDVADKQAQFRILPQCENMEENTLDVHSTCDTEPEIQKGL